MSLLQKIKRRMPGGSIYTRYAKSKVLKGTDYDATYRIKKAQYWLGRFSETYVKKCREEQAQVISTKYFQGDCYDFNIIKLPADVPIEDMAEIVQDIILPYLEGHSAMTDEGTYEEFGVQVHPGDVVIDAGANMGVFTAFAVKHRRATVHAFEPVASTVEFLRKTVELNNISSSVFVVEAGLSDHNGTSEIYISPGGATANSLVKNMMAMPESCNTETVRLMTLDDYVRDNRLERVDFIKADVEGSERNLLTGATETLKMFAPQLALCTYHLPDDPEVLTDIIKKANPKYKIVYGSKKLFARVE